MSRRTHAQVATEAVAAERAAIAAYAAVYVRQVEQLVGKGMIPADEATMLNERIRAFAGNIKAGIHR